MRDVAALRCVRDEQRAAKLREQQKRSSTTIQAAVRRLTAKKTAREKAVVLAERIRALALDGDQLLLASEFGDAMEAERVIHRATSVKRLNVFNWIDREGRTSLLTAARSGNHAVLLTLLRYGPSLREQDRTDRFGRSALGYATDSARGGAAECAAALKAAGAVFSAFELEAKLQAAARNGDAAACERLVAAAAEAMRGASLSPPPPHNNNNTNMIRADNFVDGGDGRLLSRLARAWTAGG